jgi:phage-related protein
LKNWKYNLHILAKIQSKIELLSENLLGLDDLKYLRDKIFELRIRKWTDISRIFYFTIKDETIILLDWIIKKDDKLKNWIIDKMIAYKNDYLERMKNKVDF